MRAVPRTGRGRYRGRSKAKTWAAKSLTCASYVGPRSWWAKAATDGKVLLDPLTPAYLSPVWLSRLQARPI